MVDIAPHLIVNGDAVLLRELVGHLLDNASRYTVSGQTITISAQHHGPSVHVRVADDGEGVADDERERIFERFYRGSKAARHGAAGNGLGLYRAREIAHAHGGSISLETCRADVNFLLVLPAANPLEPIRR